MLVITEDVFWRMVYRVWEYGVDCGLEGSEIELFF